MTSARAAYSTSRCILFLSTGLALAAGGCAEPSPTTDLLSPTDSGQVVDLLALDSCDDCIDLSPVVTLGDSVGEGIIAFVVRAAVRDSSGNFWLGEGGNALRVFGADGGYKRQVGRRGKGPLEFINPTPVHTDARGRVHVFDNRNMRETVVGPDYALAYDRQLPGPVLNVAPLRGDERYVVNMYIRTAAQLGVPLHILESDSVVRSFGLTTDSAANPLSPMEGQRKLTASEGDRIFSAKVWDYRIDVWNTLGRPIVGFSGPTLNEAEPQAGAYSRTNPPANRIEGIQIDSRGRLWVVRWQRRSDWFDNTTERLLGNGSVVLEPRDGDYRNFYSTIIDLIDPNLGRIIASVEVPQLLTSFVGEALVIENTTIGSGHPQVVVWRLGARVP